MSAAVATGAATSGRVLLLRFGAAWGELGGSRRLGGGCGYGLHPGGGGGGMNNGAPHGVGGGGGGKRILQLPQRQCWRQHRARSRRSLAETEEVDTAKVETIAVAKIHSLAVASEAFAIRALYALLTVMAATVAMAVRSRKAGRGAAPPVSQVHLRRAQYLPWQRREAAVTGRTSPTAGWNVGASLARRER